jgi:hypothetical protein
MYKKILPLVFGLFASVLFLSWILLPIIAKAQGLININPGLNALAKGPEISQIFVRDLGGGKANIAAKVSPTGGSSQLFSCKGKQALDYSDLKIASYDSTYVCFGTVDYVRTFDATGFSVFASNKATNGNEGFNNTKTGATIDNSGPEIVITNLENNVGKESPIEITNPGRFNIGFIDNSYVLDCVVALGQVAIPTTITKDTCTTNEIAVGDYVLEGSISDVLGNPTNLGPIQIKTSASPPVENSITQAPDVVIPATETTTENPRDLGQFSQQNIIPGTVYKTPLLENPAPISTSFTKSQILTAISFWIGVLVLGVTVVGSAIKLVFSGKLLNILPKIVPGSTIIKGISSSVILVTASSLLVLPALVQSEDSNSPSKNSVLNPVYSSPTLYNTKTKGNLDLLGDNTYFVTPGKSEKNPNPLGLSLLVSSNQNGQVTTTETDTYKLSEVEKLNFEIKSTEKSTKQYNLQASFNPITSSKHCNPQNLFYNQKISSSSFTDPNLYGETGQNLTKDLYNAIKNSSVDFYFRVVEIDEQGVCQEKLGYSNNVKVSQKAGDENLTTEQKQALNPKLIQLYVLYDGKPYYEDVGKEFTETNAEFSFRINQNTKPEEFKKRFTINPKDKTGYENLVWQVSSLPFESSGACSESPDGLLASGVAESFDSQNPNDFIIDYTDIIVIPKPIKLSTSVLNWLVEAPKSTIPKLQRKTITHSEVKKELIKANGTQQTNYYTRVIRTDSTGLCDKGYLPSNSVSTTEGKEIEFAQSGNNYIEYDAKPTLAITGVTYEPGRLAKDPFDPDGHYVFKEDYGCITFNEKKTCVYYKGDGFKIPVPSKGGNNDSWWDDFTEFVGDVFDGLTSGWDYIASTYNKAYDKLVELSADYMLAQFSFACNLATSQTDNKIIAACKKGVEYAKEAIIVGTKQTLAATFGIPPSLPSSEALSDDAISYIAETIEEETGVPAEVTEEGLKVAREELRKEESKTATSSGNLYDYLKPDPNYDYQKAKVSITVTNNGDTVDGGLLKLSHIDDPSNKQIPNNEVPKNVGLWEGATVRIPKIDPGQSLTIPLQLDANWKEYKDPILDSCPSNICGYYLAINNQQNRWNHILATGNLKQFISIRETDSSKDLAYNGVSTSGYLKITDYSQYQQCYYKKGDKKITCFKPKTVPVEVNTTIKANEKKVVK